MVRECDLFTMVPALVDDADPSRLRYLAATGLVPGVEVEVTSREPFGGPLLARVAREGGGERATGPKPAATIRVVVGA